MRSKLLLTVILFVLTGRALYAQAPKITSFSPAQGHIGTLITITGTNLGSPTAFTVGGAAAIVIANTGTQLVGFVMPGTVTGPVSVTNAGGSANSTSNFSVIPTATAQMVSDGGLGFQDYGVGIALSANGNTGIMGFDDIGTTIGNYISGAAVEVRTGPFIYGTETNDWTPQGTYLPFDTYALVGTGGFIPYPLINSVAISADGNTAVIGSASNNVTTNTNDQTGSVWFFTRSGGTWTQQGSLKYGTGAVGASNQGIAVAMSADGNTALVGGSGDNNSVGAVWVFTRSNGVWTQQGSKLVGTGAVGASNQGRAIALSADGNTALVGAPSDNPDVNNTYDYLGAVWVFTRANGVWTQQGSKLVGSGYQATPQGYNSVNQGQAVAISADGNTALIGGGSDNNGIGATWVFTRSGSAWSQQGSKLIGSGVVYNYASQGSGVALSADGNTALIGGPNDNSNVGAIWEFTRSGANWTQLGAKISGYGKFYFGSSTALSTDGTTAFVTRPGVTTSVGSGNVSIYLALLPADTTLAATNITTTGATLNGTVDGNGAASTTVTMQYGTSPTLAGATTATLTTGANPVTGIAGSTAFTSVLTGLTPGTTYYFSITGTNIYGTAPGAILSFTTAGTKPPPTITAADGTGSASGFITACFGSPSASPGIQQFTVTGSALTANIAATAPKGFEVSLTPNSGYSDNVSLVPSGGTVNGTVYVRSAAADAPGNISGNVVLTSAGAGTQNVAVSGVVNALPTVSPVPAQTFTNAVASTAINFSGTANSFSWTNDTPAIGLAASGNGNIASFTPVNTGTSPITAHISVTPVTAGIAYVPNLGDGTVSAVNIITNTVAATIPVGSQPYGVAVSPDGTRVYITNTYSRSVSVISTASNTVISTISLSNQPQCIALSPDGSIAYITMANNNLVSVVNTSTYAVTASIPVGTYPYGLAVSPDGSRVYVGNLVSNTVSVINTATNTVIGSIAVGTGPIAISVSPDGSRAYVSNYQSANVSVINTTTNTVVSTITVGTSPCGSVVNSAVTQLYVANYGSNNISVVNLTTNAITASVNTGTKPVGVSLSTNGSELFVANSGSGNVSVINTATNKVSATIPVGSAPNSLGNFVTANGCSGAPQTFTITVDPTAAQPETITFPPLTSEVYGSADIAPGATSTNTTIPITYSSSNTAVATIVNSQIHITGAGSTNITASQAGNANYSAATPVLQAFTVTPAPLTISANNQSTVYGVGNPPLTVSYNTFVNGDSQSNLTTQPVVSTTATATSVAGTYPITVSGASDPNYIITYVPGTLTVSAVSPTAASQPATLVSATGATLNGTVTDGGAPTTAQFLFGTDPHLTGASAVAVSTGVSPIPAGTGSVAFSAVVSGLLPATSYYYEITGTDAAGGIGGGILSFTTTSLPSAVITFTSPASAVYGSTDFTPNGSSTNAGTPITYSSSNTGVATITGSGNVHIVGVGSAQITASQAAGNGFTAATPVVITLVVSPASLIVTASNASKVYGSVNPGLYYTYSGFVAGDDSTSVTTKPKISTTASSSSGVGGYPINVSGASATNYTITYVSGTLTVGPASLTITADNKTKVQGAVNPVLTITYTGFVNGDTGDNLSTQPTISTTATTSSETGTYAITVSGAADPNYTITYVPGILTVTAQFVFNPLPVKTYGDPDFNPGATGSNVTYSSGNTSVATITDGGDIHIVGAGTSVITATSGESSLQQTLTVKPAPLTITADDLTRVYGAANPALTVTYKGFVYSDNASSLATAPTISTTAVTTSDVGDYPITVSGAVDPNYSITYAAGVLKITKASQTIDFAAIPDQLVNGKYDLAGVTASSGLPVTFVLSDPGIAAISGTTLTSTQVGSETVTASQPGNGNYLPAGVVAQSYLIRDDSGDDVVVNPVVSPNGDGIDDVLNIKNIENYPDNKLTLVNRNGVMIFQITGYNNTSRVFDGHSSVTGVFQQQGTLLYILDYNVNGQMKRKTGFTVLRY